MVVLEAMAYGCPVIASNKCGAASVVAPGSNGFVFEAGNCDELAALLQDLTPPMLTQLGKAAFETAKQYTWRAYGDRLVSLYRDLGL